MGLTSDSLLLVCAKLPTRDLFSVRRVCKQWNKVASHDVLWKPLFRWFFGRPLPSFFSMYFPEPEHAEYWDYLEELEDAMDGLPSDEEGKVDQNDVPPKALAHQRIFERRMETLRLRENSSKVQRRKGDWRNWGDTLLATVALDTTLTEGDKAVVSSALDKKLSLEGPPNAWFCHFVDTARQIPRPERLSFGDYHPPSNSGFSMHEKSEYLRFNVYCAPEKVTRWTHLAALLVSFLASSGYVPRPMEDSVRFGYAWGNYSVPLSRVLYCVLGGDLVWLWNHLEAMPVGNKSEEVCDQLLSDAWNFLEEMKDSLPKRALHKREISETFQKNKKKVGEKEERGVVPLLPRVVKNRNVKWNAHLIKSGKDPKSKESLAQVNFFDYAEQQGLKDRTFPLFVGLSPNVKGDFSPFVYPNRVAGKSVTVPFEGDTDNQLRFEHIIAMGILDEADTRLGPDEYTEIDINPSGAAPDYKDVGKEIKQAVKQCQVFGWYCAGDSLVYKANYSASEDNNSRMWAPKFFNASHIWFGCSNCAFTAYSPQTKRLTILKKQLELQSY